MDKEIVVRLHSSFEDMVRKHPDTGTEFWCARDHVAHISKMVDRGIVPEALPPAEDVKKVERRLMSEQKKLPS